MLEKDQCCIVEVQIVSQERGGRWTTACTQGLWKIWIQTKAAGIIWQGQWKDLTSDPGLGCALWYWFMQMMRSLLKASAPRMPVWFRPVLKGPILRMARDLQQVCTVCSILLGAVFRSAFIRIYLIWYTFKKVVANAGGAEKQIWSLSWKNPLE